MAGKGKRMRPHTLTTPKALIPIAGQPIIMRLITKVYAMCTIPIRTIGFVVSESDTTTQAQLTKIAQDVGAEARFYDQAEALGTAHAVLCAAALLQGPVIIAFSDTLFTGSISLDMAKESVVWVKQVIDPSAFGVVRLSPRGTVVEFVEKPSSFVSDLAIIGIYYFREGRQLMQALQKLVGQDTREHKEYQLTDALKAMNKAGTQFSIQTVEEWLDCGNKAAVLRTNQRFLTLLQGEQNTVADTAQLSNSVLIAPVCLGQGVVIENTVLGPHVSVGDHSYIRNARIKDSILQTHSTVVNTTLHNSILGNHVHLQGKSAEVSIGDYTTIMHEG